MIDMDFSKLYTKQFQSLAGLTVGEIANNYDARNVSLKLLWQALILTKMGLQST